jgi:ubiquinone/menaquinone biosynthesis C-methylase UbiE
MPILLKMLDFLVKQVDLEKAKVVLSLCEQSPSARLLDCGCSSGEFTLKVAEIIGTKETYGIDITKEGVVEAKVRGIEAQQGNLNKKLPFEDESFNVVLANHVIEHLSNTDVFVKEIYRVLKTGGYALIATSNLAAYYNILYLLLGKQPYVAMVSDEILAGSWMPLKRCSLSENHGPTHRRVFTLEALKELLEYNGFRVEKSVGTGFFPLPNPLAKIMCSIDKKHATNITVKARKISK